MQKRKVPTWLIVMLAPFGLLLSLPVLWVISSITARPVHPAPESVPTTADSTPSSKWTRAADQGRQLVRSSVAAQNLPGLSVAIGVDGDVVWAEGFGFADLGAEVPVTPRHRFRLGTASTALSSAAAGLLLESGGLKLQDEIQTYVPAFPRTQQPLTLRQLMGHSPGIRLEGGNDKSLTRRHCEQPVDALDHLKGNWQVDQPGSQFRFSIYDWILVSAAIEAAAKQPFLAFMQEKVFAPLAMSDTAADPGPDPAEVEGEDFPLFILIRELIYDPGATRGAQPSPIKKQQRHAAPYVTRFRSDPVYGMHAMRIADFSCYAGASVFVSTPSDMVRFGMAMNKGRLLQPGTVELLQKSQRLTSGGETGYGLGWEVETVALAGKPTLSIGHNGDVMGGMVASLITFPTYGIAVAVTSNIPFAGTDTLALRIAETFVEQGGIPARK